MCGASLLRVLPGRATLHCVLTLFGELKDDVMTTQAPGESHCHPGVYSWYRTQVCSQFKYVPVPFEI